MSLEILLIGLLCSNFIVILNDSENPYKSLLLTKNPVGIPYSLRKAKNPYCREKSLRVAALKRLRHYDFQTSVTGIFGEIDTSNLLR